MRQRGCQGTWGRGVQWGGSDVSNEDRQTPSWLSRESMRLSLGVVSLTPALGVEST